MLAQANKQVNTKTTKNNTLVKRKTFRNNNNVLKDMAHYYGCESARNAKNGTNVRKI